MIEKYVVKYKNEKIGELTVKEDTYVYIPNMEKIASLEKMGERILNLLKEEITDETIPFFESRIRNCKRFGVDEMGYHTDFYSLALTYENEQARV